MQNNNKKGTFNAQIFGAFFLKTPEDKKKIVKDDEKKGFTDVFKIK